MLDKESTLRKLHELIDLWIARYESELRTAEARMNSIDDLNPPNKDKILPPLDKVIAELEAKYMRAAVLKAKLPPVRVLDENDVDSWSAYLTKLETDAAYREKENYIAEIGLLALNKAHAKLGEWHQFINDEIDLPILNHKTYEAAVERDNKPEEYDD